MSGKNAKKDKKGNGLTLAEVDVINSNSFKQSQLNLERHHQRLTKEFGEQMLLHNREYSELKMFLQSIRTIEATNLDAAGMVASDRPTTAPSQLNEERNTALGHLKSIPERKTLSATLQRPSKFSRSVSDTAVSKLHGVNFGATKFAKSLPTSPKSKSETQKEGNRIKFKLPLEELEDSPNIDTPRSGYQSDRKDPVPKLELSNLSNKQDVENSTQPNKNTPPNRTSRRHTVANISIRKNLGLDDLDDFDDPVKSKSAPDLSARSDKQPDELDESTVTKKKTSSRSLMPLKSPPGVGYGNLGVLVASQKQILARRKASSAHTNTRLLSPGECIEMQIKRRDQARSGEPKTATFTPRAIDFSARRKNAGVRKLNGVTNINTT